MKPNYLHSGGQSLSHFFSVFSGLKEIKRNVAVPMHAAIKTPTSGSTVDMLKLTLLFSH